MLRSVGSYFLANLINALIPFFLLPILTRYLSVSEYGEVAIFTSIVGFISAMVGTAFVGSVSRKFFDEDFDSSNYSGFVATALSLGFAISLGLLLVIAFAGEAIANGLNIKLVYIYSALLVAYSGFVVQIKLNQFQIRKKAFSYGKLQVSWAMLNAVFSLLSVALLGLGVSGRIGSQVLAVILVMTLSVYLLLKSNQGKFEKN